ncbi:hypothetical protein A2U01_0088910, partial [Trifolium medium]|nr:hypothetical protein [Trifolium medium]
AEEEEDKKEQGVAHVMSCVACYEAPIRDTIPIRYRYGDTGYVI